MNKPAPQEIAAEYVRIETMQNKLPMGADHDRIVNILYAKWCDTGVTIRGIREAVIDHAFMRPV